MWRAHRGRSRRQELRGRDDVEPHRTRAGPDSSFRESEPRSERGWHPRLDDRGYWQPGCPPARTALATHHTEDTPVLLHRTDDQGRASRDRIRGAERDQKRPGNQPLSPVLHPLFGRATGGIPPRGALDLLPPGGALALLCECARRDDSDRAKASAWVVAATSLHAEVGSVGCVVSLASLRWAASVESRAPPSSAWWKSSSTVAPTRTDTSSSAGPGWGCRGSPASISRPAPN